MNTMQVSIDLSKLKMSRPLQDEDQEPTKEQWETAEGRHLEEATRYAAERLIALGYDLQSKRRKPGDKKGALLDQEGNEIGTWTIALEHHKPEKAPPHKGKADDTRHTK